MGLEDRDYYRENYAKKHGMHYNARNATYSADAQTQDRRKPPRRPPEVIVDVIDQPRRVVGSDWHWSLKLLLWLAIVSLVLLIVRFINGRA